MSAGNTSYTHTASKSFPIIVGKEYTYTVRAYNNQAKKYGTYDKTGLTVRTRPEKVQLNSAVWNVTQTAVTVSWKEAAGGNYYRIYRKTASSPSWKRIATVKTGVLKYVDKTAVKGEKTVYMVRAYYSKTRVLGAFQKNGVTATVSQTAILMETCGKLLKDTKTAQKTDQVILVVGHNLSLWEKNRSGDWKLILSVYCGYGRNGLSADRYEGDGTTPIGSFPILHAFGTAANPGTQMTYRKVTANSYWSGEKSTYNQWVESTTPISGEHLIDYYQYKYAMAIGFNRDPVIYKKGSAIFLHCKSTNTWSTSGCVSVTETIMKRLLLKCKDGAYIMIVKQQQDIAKY